MMEEVLVNMNVHFIGSNEICCILRNAAFSKKCHLCNNFIFFFSYNMFFINHVLQFTSPPQ